MNPALFENLLRGITVNVSEMFRDPSFFKVLRERVIPHLKTYPFVRICFRAMTPPVDTPITTALKMRFSGAAIASPVDLGAGADLVVAGRQLTIIEALFGPQAEKATRCQAAVEQVQHLFFE